MERMFHSDTQFHYLLSNRPMNIITKIHQCVFDMANFEKLNKKFIKLIEKSKYEVFEDFINKITLDSNPSDFLIEIKTAAEKVGVSEEKVRQKLEKALPANIAADLAPHQEIPLYKLGKLTDDLMNLRSSSRTVFFLKQKCR